MRPLLAILIGLGGMSRLLLAAAGTATSTLPEFYSPGIAFELAISVQPNAGAAGYAVEDILPVGWNANSFTDGGNLVNGKLKWGPFLDATAREVKCQVTPALSASGPVTFQLTINNTGQADLSVAITHNVPCTLLTAVFVSWERRARSPLLW